MSGPLVQFNANLRQARDVLGLAVTIDVQTSGVIITNDLLRASLVAGVSALDHYVHEIVRELMIEIADGNRPSTEAFRRFPTTTDVTMRAAQALSARRWMDEAVRHQHGHLAFQHPDKIADAIRLVWDGELWPTVATSLGKDAGSMKRQIKLIVGRRNRIVHETDRDPTPPHDRWAINRSDVEQSLSTIESIVSTIDRIL